MTKKILIITFSFLALFFFGLLLGKHVQSKEMKKIVYVDFLTEEITVEETEHKYQFLPKELSDYICQMCTELEIDSDLAIAILMQENPQVNLDATHRNENGTMDVGLWQLNDKYLYTDFSKNFWQFENVELNAFDWKHNTFIALH